MNKTPFLLLTFCSSFIFSQQKNLIDAVIIKKTNDTVRSKVLIYSNLFKKDLLDINSFLKVSQLVDDNGKRSGKIRSEEIKKMYFTDLTGKDRIFLSNKKLLTEVMFVGKKIKWYRDLSSHPYDGSVQFADYFVDDRNQTYKTGLFSSFNKKLLEATASKPELAQKIEKARTDADVIEILKEYEQ